MILVPHFWYHDIPIPCFAVGTYNKMPSQQKHVPFASNYVTKAIIFVIFQCVFCIIFWSKHVGLQFFNNLGTTSTPRSL